MQLGLLVVAFGGNVCAFLRGDNQTYVQEQLQEVLDRYTAKNKYTLQMGYKSGSMEFAIASGSVLGRPTLPHDRFAFGSGTKPMTSALVLKLVEQAKVRLDDKASIHVDPILAQNGTSMVQLFGPEAAEITVDDLIGMHSGLPDLDVPSIDEKVLLAGTFFPPFASMRDTSALGQPFGCRPGNCTEYSSTNYMLAGMILLHHTPLNQSTWLTYDQKSLFPADLATSEFANTTFPLTGPMSNALSIPGYTKVSTQASPVKVFRQDASILGWTLGNCVAPTLDMARFMYALLGPVSEILSASGVALMRQMNLIDVGWEAGHLEYGRGLMVQSVSSKSAKPARLEDVGSYIGHGGDTYGFVSEQGFFPSLNATISVGRNDDTDGATYKHGPPCAVFKELFRIMHDEEADFQCDPP
jgi:CubicO group peptidase (beta-lactamase class C family)